MAWYSFNFINYLFHVLISVIHIQLRVKKTGIYDICGLKDLTENGKNDGTQSSCSY